ncbi:EamA family transporter [Roseibium sp. Sym1]|uniref:EamA family transporter n=1 Tax=Roseibium sp. Sym1 TaxID=3016006 RepID=UPI0022B4FFAC|nr:EamA family transporter [Roseibium sp. Sym1]
MRPRDVALALGVVSIWGLNFVVIKIGLQDFPPVFFAALRFALAAVPAVFFLRPPNAPVRLIILYGLFMFAIQFALLFTGMALGMPAGLASLVLQGHVFVTIGLAAILFREKVRPSQLAGAGLAASGLGLVALNTGGETTMTGLVLVLLAACSWAAANLVSKRIGRVDMLALVAWGSLVAPLPLLLLSLALEGPRQLGQAIEHLTLGGAAALFYVVYPTTLLGFFIWSTLLSRYPAAVVAPFTLLVPVVGFLSAAVLLDEALESWKLAAAVLVVAGLGVNQLGARILKSVIPARRQQS